MEPSQKQDAVHKMDWQPASTWMEEADVFLVNCAHNYPKNFLGLSSQIAFVRHEQEKIIVAEAAFQ